MVKDHAQKLSSRGRLDDFAVHDDLALSLLFPFPGDVDQFGLFCCEAGSRPPGLCFDLWYILGLDFGEVLLRGPTDPPAEVVVDKGRCPTVEIDRLID
jgi:hypothetical protein